MYYYYYVIVINFNYCIAFGVAIVVVIFIPSLHLCTCFCHSPTCSFPSPPSLTLSLLSPSSSPTHSISLLLSYLSLPFFLSLYPPPSLSLSLSPSFPPEGTSVWYNNPPPGRILPNNTAISVYTDVAEVRCYTGDTTTNNDATEIKKPAGSSPTLSFSNTEPGFLEKNGLTPISGVANGVYTCQYTNSSGSVSYTSFAVFPRSREPGSGSSNTSKLV